jgi:hypothetical protein
MHVARGEKREWYCHWSNGVHFIGHKLILAALVFALTSEMVEWSGHTVTDMKPIVLRTMLHFMYSGSLSNMEELDDGGLRWRNVFNFFNTTIAFSSLKVWCFAFKESSFLYEIIELRYPNSLRLFIYLFSSLIEL